MPYNIEKDFRVPYKKVCDQIDAGHDVFNKGLHRGIYVMKDQVVPYKRYIKDMVDALTMREYNRWKEYESALTVFKTNDPYQKKIDHRLAVIIIWSILLIGALSGLFIFLIHNR